MTGAWRRSNALMAIAVFGVFPGILAGALALGLNARGLVWLTTIGWFWPTLCIAITLASLIRRVIGPFRDRVIFVSAWLVTAWTWLHFPLWLMATELPASSAIVDSRGRVHLSRDSARHTTDLVWILTGGGSSRIVHHVEGTLTINSVEIKYRHVEPYIATRGHDDDLRKPIVRAATVILANEAGKPRLSRMALFERPEEQVRLSSRICSAVVADKIACPLRMSLSPQGDAKLPGALWSPYFTETEAINEKHLPTLVHLLTQDNSQLVDRDQVVARFLELADNAEDLGHVGRKPRMLTADQFDEVVKRVVAMPGAGDAAAGILIEAGRLSQQQRRELRGKVLLEAKMETIFKQAGPLRISDAEIVMLAGRIGAAIETAPGIAVLALETFGERLPRDLQQAVVTVIAGAGASHALAALRFAGFSHDLRRQLMNKVLRDASSDDFDTARLSREKLGDMLRPEEMRLLIASAVEKSEASATWLDFSTRNLPLREMTPAERKSLLDGRLFGSAKAALEFASENRQYLDAADVNDVTIQYARTIMPDFCLHLSHRNENRKFAYFSEAQLQIFRDCARAK